MSGERVVEYIRYRIEPEQRADFEQAYVAAAAVLARAGQCVDYELTRCVDEPVRYVLRITWTSAEDHLRGFRTGELFPPFFAAIRPFVGNIEEMRHYAPTPVHGSGAA